jgi:membrane protease YdiL (CAAX protease family)
LAKGALVRRAICATSFKFFAPFYARHIDRQKLISPNLSNNHHNHCDGSFEGVLTTENSATKSLGIPQQSLWRSIILHLLPGALTTILFVIAAPALNSLGYPSNFAFLLLGLFVLVPFELGFLFYQGKKRNGALSLKGIVLYREPMPVREYVLLATALLLYANFILVVVYPPIAQMLVKTLFFWLPDWYFLSSSLEYTKSVLLMTALIGLFVNGFVAPITEELYFRGYLLPRISRLKAGARVDSGSSSSRVRCLVEKKHLSGYDCSRCRECAWINAHDSDDP